MAGPLIPRALDALPAWGDPELAESAHANAAAAESAGTRRAYESACRTFHRWAATHNVPINLPMQPEVLVGYVAYLSAQKKAPTTVRMALWAIGRTHHKANMPSPTRHPQVTGAIMGYTRRWLDAGNRQRRVAAMTVSHLRRMVALPPTHSATQECRDRAILLLSVALAARRSEMIALVRTDVDITDRGLRVYFARSKTDQLGEGGWLGVPLRDDELCATRAVRAWVEMVQPNGPLFCRVTPHGRVLRDKTLGGNSIARIIQDFARRLGDPTLPPSSVAGHSPRATFVTLLLGQGVDPLAIAQHSRHRNLDVLRKYDRGLLNMGPRSILNALYVPDDEGGNR